MTFTPQDAQAAWVITLKGTKVTSAITNITTDAKLIVDNNVYDLSGRVVAQKGYEGLKKGIYIFNNKKFVVK